MSNNNTSKIVAGNKLEYNGIIWDVLAVYKGRVSLRAVSADGPKGVMYMGLMYLWQMLDRKHAFILADKNLVMVA